MDEQLSLDEILAHMTPVGRYEFELATLRAQVARRNDYIKALEELAQPQGAQVEGSQSAEE